MTNMESLYQGFKDYFKNNQEKINYFLDVLKNTREDSWEYEDLSLMYKCYLLKYDNVEIRYESDYDNLEENLIKVYVDNKKIFETSNETDELFIELFAMIERAEEREKNEEK